MSTCKQVVGSASGCSGPVCDDCDWLLGFEDDPADAGWNRHGPEDMLAGVILLTLFCVASMLVFAAVIDAVWG